MRINDTIETIAAVWDDNPKQSIYLEGPPGVGKTAITYEVAKKLGVPEDRVIIWRPSLHDPVDLSGVPSVNDGTTKWNPPAWLHQLQHGDWVLCIDELPQAVPMMQNALAGLKLDRFIGDVTLSDGVRVMSTGNRTKDKAGANRVVSQLANRVLRLEAEVHIDDWVEWALRNKIDTMGIAFLRWKPSALHDFDPDRFSNATPRSWEMAFNIPTSMPDGHYYEALAGLVTEGWAAEYTGFRRLIGRLPSIDSILMDPTNAEVPEEPEVKYAMVANLITRCSEDNYAGLLAYVERLPKDFQVLFHKGIIEHAPKIMRTREFIQWSTDNVDVFK